MVNHGLTTGAMFFLVGIVWEKKGTLRFAELGGLAKAAPIFAAIFLAVVMSAVGLPGLNGFVGEFLVLVGTFVTHRWWAVVATSAVVTGAIYMLWAYQRVFHGPALASDSKVSDISWRQIAAVAPLLVGIVFLGVYPKPFLDRVTPSVNYLLAHVEQAAPNAHVPPSTTLHVTFNVPANQNVLSSTSKTTGSKGPAATGTSATGASGGAKSVSASKGGVG